MNDKALISSEVDVGEWEPTDDDKRRVAGYANRLTFVTWDRFTAFRDGDLHVLSMYGWIPRDDGRSDFVLLRWDDFEHNPYPMPTTSSAQYSAEIAKLLFGDQPWFDPADHQECVRVEDHFDRLIYETVRL